MVKDVSAGLTAPYLNPPWKLEAPTCGNVRLAEYLDQTMLLLHTSHKQVEHFNLSLSVSEK